MLKPKYFLKDIFILSAEKQPINSSWRKIEWLQIFPFTDFCRFIFITYYIIVKQKEKKTISRFNIVVIKMKDSTSRIN